MGLKEQIAAKQAEKEETVEVLEPIVEITAVAETPVAVAETPQFRVSGFAYQFKGADWTLKANRMGVYVPQSQEQLDFLIHQVTVGNILFN
jgi:hypothetical protein